MPSLGLETQHLPDLCTTVDAESEMRFSAPKTAEEFAQRVIFTICSTSVTPAVGRRTYARCSRAIAFGATARIGFRHPGKADAVDLVWRERDRLYAEYRVSSDKLAFLATLPWIGPVTKHALARRLGLAAESARRAVA